MCVGIAGAEVETPGDVGTLMTLGGAGLMFNSMLIFKSSNHPEFLTQQQYVPLSDWATFLMVKDTFPF